MSAPAVRWAAGDAQTNEFSVGGALWSAVSLARDYVALTDRARSWPAPVPAAAAAAEKSARARPGNGTCRPAIDRSIGRAACRAPFRLQLADSAQGPQRASDSTSGARETRIGSMRGAPARRTTSAAGGSPTARLAREQSRKVGAVAGAGAERATEAEQGAAGAAKTLPAPATTSVTSDMNKRQQSPREPAEPARSEQHPLDAAGAISKLFFG